MYDCGVGMMFSPGRRAVNHLCELEPHESSAVPSGSEYRLPVGTCWTMSPESTVSCEFWG